ncbi:galectin-10-like [Rhinolophus ferrumequinum]|uniref:Galectin n=1 Tax=Rhinolophus ferrumequinum TaxID=59479 RepID=A0A671G690_RHIFE|nr:galectin-10-like [Rhinolophus ferrumequinum]
MSMSKLPVPYQRRLSLSPGSSVTIVGKPTLCFSMNPQLQLDLHTGNDENSDIAFHFAVCFGNSVVMNSRDRGEWRLEVKSSEMPFENGKQFKLCIIVLQNEYQVMVNDKHWYSFPHRVDPRSVEMMQVCRDVSLISVSISEREG